MATLGLSWPFGSINNLWKKWKTQDLNVRWLWKTHMSKFLLYFSPWQRTSAGIYACVIAGKRLCFDHASLKCKRFHTGFATQRVAAVQQPTTSFRRFSFLWKQLFVLHCGKHRVFHQCASIFVLVKEKSPQNSHCQGEFSKFSTCVFSVFQQFSTNVETFVDNYEKRSSKL